MFDDFILFVKEIYGINDNVPLHQPCLCGNESKYVLDTINSTFVSSVGAYVDLFEEKISSYTGSKYAIATVNGTSALHVALKVIDVGQGTEVITQAVTFVATCNAIEYCGAHPVFVDIDRETLGMSPSSLNQYLKEHVELKNERAWNKTTGRYVSACVPMHTFGSPVDIEAITSICNHYGIPVVEDAAESLGSTWKGQHTGTYGKVGVLSFNGNKIITTGGGGMILTDDESIATRAKHLTTTGKQSHQWEYIHDEIAYNYRMPNINAALGVAQMESISTFVDKKRAIAERYHEWCDKHGFSLLTEHPNARSNYWLNAVFLKDRAERDLFLSELNKNGITARPMWELMHRLNMYSECHRGDMTNSEWAADRVVNVPSGIADCH